MALGYRGVSKQAPEYECPAMASGGGAGGVACFSSLLKRPRRCHPVRWGSGRGWWNASPKSLDSPPRNCNACCGRWPEHGRARRNEAKGYYDFQCALMSLPLQFNTNLVDTPNKVPYLAAEEKLVARWKARIGEMNSRSALPGKAIKLQSITGDPLRWQNSLPYGACPEFA